MTNIVGINFILSGVILLAFIYSSSFLQKGKNREHVKLFKKKYKRMLLLFSWILIFCGSYLFLSKFFYSSSEVEIIWTQKDRQDLMSICIDQAANENYPDLSQKFCECSTEKIMTLMTKKQFLENSKKSDEERINKIESVTSECLKNYELKRDSIKKLAK